MKICPGILEDSVESSKDCGRFCGIPWNFLSMEPGARLFVLEYFNSELYLLSTFVSYHREQYRKSGRSLTTKKPWVQTPALLSSSEGFNLEEVILKPEPKLSQL